MLCGLLCGGRSDAMDEHNPVILAGFGRFGNIVGRLLLANGVGTTVLDVDSDQVDMLRKLGLKQPDNGIARSPAEAFEVARRIGYPVLVRPSYVLGGRAMKIVYNREAL